MEVKRKETQSSRVERVAKKLNVSKKLVEGIISAYIEDLTQSALNGEDIEVRCLFSIRMKEVDGGYVPRGAVSDVLRQRCEFQRNNPDV